MFSTYAPKTYMENMPCELAFTHTLIIKPETVIIFCLFDLLLYVNCKQLKLCCDSQLLTLFLCKPPRGSLPVFSTYTLPGTDNLLFLNQWKREIFFHKRMCRNCGVRSRAVHLPSGHATNQATMPDLRLLSALVNDIHNRLWNQPAESLYWETKYGHIVIKLKITFDK